LILKECKPSQDSVLVVDKNFLMQTFLGMAIQRNPFLVQ